MPPADAAMGRIAPAAARLAADAARKGRGLCSERDTYLARLLLAALVTRMADDERRAAYAPPCTWPSSAADGGLPSPCAARPAIEPIAGPGSGTGRAMRRTTGPPTGGPIMRDQRKQFRLIVTSIAAAIALALPLSAVAERGDAVYYEPPDFEDMDINDNDLLAPAEVQGRSPLAGQWLRFDTDGDLGQAD